MFVCVMQSQEDQRQMWKLLQYQCRVTTRFSEATTRPTLAPTKYTGWLMRECVAKWELCAAWLVTMYAVMDEELLATRFTESLGDSLKSSHRMMFSTSLTKEDLTFQALTSG